MLVERYPLTSTTIAPKSGWHPFPQIHEREPWEALPSTVRKELIRRGEVRLDQAWQQLLATRFLEYARIGNRTGYEQDNFARRKMLSELLFAECVEGKGRFLDKIIDGVWLICEETYWGIPAHVHLQKAGDGLPDIAEPTVDLFVAETASTLAHVAYLLKSSFDDVSPLIVERIETEIDRRLLTPLLERDDFGWMSLNTRQRPNNWNPWINSNWLACVLYIETDDARRQQAIHKIFSSLDRFIASQPADGGCDEGPLYWARSAGSLFDCLELALEATNGQVNIFDEPLIQDMGRFAYRAHINGKHYINFADASPINHLDATLLYHYGKHIHDPDLMAFGAWIDGARRHAGHVGSSSGAPMRFLRELFRSTEMEGAPAYAPMHRDVWLPELQVMVARDKDQSGDGLIVAVKGGHNDERHNHNDVGSLIVYENSRPLVIDVGVGTYTDKTFSAQRYEIWTMQSGFHNLPTVNGIHQAHGRHYCATDVIYASDEDSASLTLEIGSAYPPSAGIHYWKRQVTLYRGDRIAITDVFEFEEIPLDMSLSLMSASEVAIHDDGIILLHERELPRGRFSGGGRIILTPEQFHVSVEEIPIDDTRMSPIWGDRVYRILLSPREFLRRDVWKIEIQQV